MTTTAPSTPPAERTLPVFGPGPRVLVVDGRAVAPAAVATTGRERRRGLLGTSGVSGALLITRCSSVHMVGMRYPLEVAVLDRRGRCIAVHALRPGHLGTRPRLRGRACLEAAAGSFAAWGLRVGSTVTTG